MKAKDLVIGNEYFSNKSQSWYGNTWDTKRVRVLETVVKDWHFKNGQLTEGRTYSWGNLRGIRVMMLDSETGADLKEDVVTLASVRGEWKPTNEKVQATIKAATAARLAREAAHKVESDLAGTALEFAMKAFKLGYSQIRRGVSNRIEIDPAVFMAMSQELEKQGWIYSQK
jgi:hypothetical protein